MLFSCYCLTVKGAKVWEVHPLLMPSSRQLDPMHPICQLEADDDVIEHKSHCFRDRFIGLSGVSGKKNNIYPKDVRLAPTCRYKSIAYRKCARIKQHLMRSLSIISLPHSLPH